MRRLLMMAAAAAFLLSPVTSSPAGAINTYNAQPAPERTEVGAFMALWDGTDENPDLDRFDWVCSGTMVDEDTFLTAAHCTDDWPAGTTFYVSLEEDVQGFLDEAAEMGLNAVEARDWALSEGLIVPGTPFQDPAFPGTGADSHDIGVLEVDADDIAALWTFTPAQLPTLNQLDELGGRQLDALDWWVVGYGTSEAERGPGGHRHLNGGVRLKALVDFNALNRTWVRLSMNEARGYGGACYGDSGGPNFVELPDGTLLLAATTITGDSPCYATNVVYRLDTPSARAFLEPFVDLP
ncbi:MAG: trypsin-like serine protease [Acidimicrobiales bacterium]